MTPVPKRAGAADPKNAVAQKLVFAKNATGPVVAASWQRVTSKLNGALINRTMVSTWYREPAGIN